MSDDAVRFSRKPYTITYQDLKGETKKIRRVPPPKLHEALPTDIVTLTRKKRRKTPAPGVSLGKDTPVFACYFPLSVPFPDNLAAEIKPGKPNPFPKTDTLVSSSGMPPQTPPSPFPSPPRTPPS